MPKAVLVPLFKGNLRGFDLLEKNIDRVAHKRTTPNRLDNLKTRMVPQPKLFKFKFFGERGRKTP